MTPPTRLCLKPTIPLLDGLTPSRTTPQRLHKWKVVMSSVGSCFLETHQAGSHTEMCWESRQAVSLDRWLAEPRRVQCNVYLHHQHFLWGVVLQKAAKQFILKLPWRDTQREVTKCGRFPRGHPAMPSSVIGCLRHLSILGRYFTNTMQKRLNHSHQ